MPYEHKTDRIATFDDWSRWKDKGFDIPRFVAFHLKRALPSTERPEQVQAYINQGRWIADCPDACGGAMIVSLTYPWFCCPECGAGWFPVRFPHEWMRKDIEQILLRRPLGGGTPKTRNWRPGESVEKLIAENAAHGIN